MIEQMKLPYAEDALAPYLTKEVVHLHYAKHHHAYVENLNKLIKGTNLEDKTVERIIKTKPDGPIFNNAGQIWNHNFYWKSLTPKSNYEVGSGFDKAVVAKFKTFDDFKTKFKDVAVKCFGSGWAWVVWNKEKLELELKATKNADNFVADENMIPLLVCDVWEHAYLYQKDYFADRGAYVEAFFKIANWEFASTNLEAAK